MADGMTREERIAEIRERDQGQSLDLITVYHYHAAHSDRRFLLGELTVYEKALENAAAGVHQSSDPEDATEAETLTRWLSEARKEVEGRDAVPHSG